MALSESEFSTHIPFSILEYQNGSLENLDSKLEFLILSHKFHCVQVHMSLSQVHVGFFARGEAPEHLVQLLVLDHLVQDDERARVQHLVHRRPIILVLDSYTLLIDLVLRGLQRIRNLSVQRTLQLVVYVIEVDLLIFLNQLLMLLCA